MFYLRQKLGYPIVLGWVVLCFFYACSPAKNENKLAFYHWKNAYSLNWDSTEIQRMKRLAVDYHYVKVMEVQWSEFKQLSYPSYTLNNWYCKDSTFSTTDICPTIFISPAVFERMAAEDIPDFTKNVYNKLRYICYDLSEHFPKSKGYRQYADTNFMSKPEPFFDGIAEVQIDCDWNKKGRDNYFRFLTLLKQKMPAKKLSVTLRLYPYKYSEIMGVPPTDRCMLMCYNLGNFQKEETENSIFDAKTASAYLRKKPYPLPLDIAFPIFSWGMWFREGQYKGIVHENQQKSWAKDTFTFEQAGNKTYFKTDTIIDDDYFKAGDYIRWEQAKPDEILTTAKLFQQHIGFSHAHIAFFDWDSLQVAEYEKTIQKVMEN